MRWTQMSACRQSGKPWHNIDIDIMILPLILLYNYDIRIVNYHINLPWEPCSYQSRWCRTRHVGSIPPNVVSEDWGSGKDCYAYCYAPYWVNIYFQIIVMLLLCSVNIYFQRISRKNFDVMLYSFVTVTVSFLVLLTW